MRQTSDAHRLMPSALGAGHNKANKSIGLKSDSVFRVSFGFKLKFKTGFNSKDKVTKY